MLGLHCNVDKAVRLTTAQAAVSPAYSATCCSPSGRVKLDTSCSQRPCIGKSSSESAEVQEACCCCRAVGVEQQAPTQLSRRSNAHQLCYVSGKSAGDLEWKTCQKISDNDSGCYLRLLARPPMRCRHCPKHAKPGTRICGSTITLPTSSRCRAQPLLLAPVCAITTSCMGVALLHRCRILSDIGELPSMAGGGPGGSSGQQKAGPAACEGLLH